MWSVKTRWWPLVWRTTAFLYCRTDHQPSTLLHVVGNYCIRCGQYSKQDSLLTKEMLVADLVFLVGLPSYLQRSKWRLDASSVERGDKVLPYSCVEHGSAQLSRVTVSPRSLLNTDIFWSLCLVVNNDLHRSPCQPGPLDVWWTMV
jgi:hypothetical protein